MAMARAAREGDGSTGTRASAQIFSASATSLAGEEEKTTMGLSVILATRASTSAPAALPDLPVVARFTHTAWAPGSSSTALNAVSMRCWLAAEK
ncbi:hypothetical protein D9M69_692160 [compost metagenome]